VVSIFSCNRLDRSKSSVCAHIAPASYRGSLLASEDSSHYEADLRMSIPSGVCIRQGLDQSNKERTRSWNLAAS
jgi:hypothetical protein